MKTIYVLLMQTNTIPAKLIRFFTRYEYSHVGIALDKSCETIYSFGRKKANSIANAGFTIEHKTGEFFNKFNKTICKIYEVKINDHQYKKVKKIIKKMESNKQKYKYDYFGIIPRYFGIPVTTKNKYVCSYFVASVLDKSKIYKFSKKICLIRPKDFENLKGFHEIYRGYYLSYA